MDVNINDSIVLNIVNIIKNRNIDANRSFKILNIFYENKINISVLKDTYKNIEIIDYKIQSQYDKCLYGDKEEQYEYIILNDVLEKMINVDEFINSLRNNLNKEGVIICNVLNLMHKSIVKDLLNGKFTYSNTGILNKSNLRFYTLHELRSLFDKEKYNVEHVLATILDSSIEDDEFVSKLCDITNMELKLNFNAYSYVLLAKPKQVKTLYDYVLNY